MATTGRQVVRITLLLGVFLASALATEEEEFVVTGAGPLPVSATIAESSRESFAQQYLSTTGVSGLGLSDITVVVSDTTIFIYHAIPDGLSPEAIEQFEGKPLSVSIETAQGAESLTVTLGAPMITSDPQEIINSNKGSDDHIILKFIKDNLIYVAAGGGTLLLIIIIGIVCCVRRRRKNAESVPWSVKLDEVMGMEAGATCTLSKKHGATGADMQVVAPFSDKTETMKSMKDSDWEAAGVPKWPGTRSAMQYPLFHRDRTETASRQKQGSIMKFKKLTEAEAANRETTWKVREGNGGEIDLPPTATLPRDMRLMSHGRLNIEEPKTEKEALGDGKTRKRSVIDFYIDDDMTDFNQSETASIAEFMDQMAEDDADGEVVDGIYDNATDRRTGMGEYAAVEDEIDDDGEGEYEDEEDDNDEYKAEAYQESDVYKTDGSEDDNDDRHEVVKHKDNADEECDEEYDEYEGGEYDEGEDYEGEGKDYGDDDDDDDDGEDYHFDGDEYEYEYEYEGDGGLEFTQKRKLRMSAISMTDSQGHLELC